MRDIKTIVKERLLRKRIVYHEIRARDPRMQALATEQLSMARAELRDLRIGLVTQQAPSAPAEKENENNIRP